MADGRWYTDLFAWIIVVSRSRVGAKEARI